MRKLLPLLLIPLLFAACSHNTYVQPEVHLAVIGKTPCNQPTIPMTTSVIHGQAQETVNVCLDNHPYPFIIDTGSVQSTINDELAADLHLTQSGPRQTFAGLGCIGTYRQVKIVNWSLGTNPLPPLTISAQTIPGMGKAVGLLGSDVLSHFNSVRLNFHANSLQLNAAPAGQPTPVHIDRTPGNVAITLPITIGGHSRNFLLDTGASQSAVDTSIRLHPLGQDELDYTICSQTTVPVVRTGKWSAVNLNFHPTQVGSVAFGNLAASGIVGLLGSDELTHYQYLILDYQHSAIYTP